MAEPIARTLRKAAYSGAYTRALDVVATAQYTSLDGSYLQANAGSTASATERTEADVSASILKKLKA